MGRARLSGVVLLLAAAVSGCAATGSAEPAFAELSWRDLERGIDSTLVSRGFGDFDALRRSGRLDPSIKVIEAEDMGNLLAVLRRHRFFDRAAILSPDAPELRGVTSQIIGFRDAREVRTLVFRTGGVEDPEIFAWNRDFVEIKKAILAVHRNTVQYTLAPEPGGGR